MDTNSNNKVNSIYLTSAYIPLAAAIITGVYLFGLIDQIEIIEDGMQATVIGFGYFLLGSIIIFSVTLTIGFIVFTFWYLNGATKEEMTQGCYKAHKALNSGSTYKTPNLVKLERWSWQKTLVIINWFYKSAT